MKGFRRLVLARFPSGFDWGTTRACVPGATSEHHDGRAWDWGVDANNPKQLATAGQLLTWLTAVGPDGQPGYHARRLGIMYIIFNRHIWGQYRAAEGWRPLTGSSPHLDHVHFSFTWNGALKRTSFWKGRVFREDFGPCSPAPGQPTPPRTGPNFTPCPR